MNFKKTLKKILILDFGSQYSELIARRVRELGVYCELHPFDVSNAFIEKFNPRGVILSGGPRSVTEKVSPRAPQIVFELGCPVLGICYGMQTMAAQCGGKVSKGKNSEFARTPFHILKTENLFADLPRSFSVWMSHGDAVTTLPPGFVVIGQTENTSVAAMANPEKNFYGLQFHPEVTHTQHGTDILKHFLFSICGCEKDWTPQKMVSELISEIRVQVKNDQVLLALSGGVDSSVLAVLLREAIGDQLHCLFVDHGLLRLNEAEDVLKMFSALRIPVQKVDAAPVFLKALQGKKDPEQKRKIVGKTFIQIFEKATKKLKNIQWLAQGTIYPDVIESAHTGKGEVIKSHHNVGGLPARMRLKLLEPLRTLFKDEVRTLGKILGLPKILLQRHPFPGPGLSVRILGAVDKKFIEILRKADAIFIEELRNSGWYEKTSQAFAVFLPIKTVGVKGDARRYEYVIALRAVETTDFMTAQWAVLPTKLLSRVSERILNEVPHIVRVVYDISHKPPATIEWE